jgi:DNA-binding MarR family transcriptional regulator
MSKSDFIDPDLAHDLDLVRSTCLVFATRRTANLLTRVYNERLADLGLEATQFTLLCAVASGRAESATELARQIGVERSTLVRNLDRMIAAGLIETQPGEGRRLLHQLTPLGRERLEAALIRWRAAQGAMLAALPEAADDNARQQLRLLRKAAQPISRSAA